MPALIFIFGHFGSTRRTGPPPSLFDILAAPAGHLNPVPHLDLYKNSAPDFLLSANFDVPDSDFYVPRPENGFLDPT